MKDVNKNYQAIDFCGVYAHHQNRIAEQSIRTIIESASTLLLHTYFNWPDKISYNLWPFVVRHAVNIYNNLPQKDPDYCTPEQVFAGVTHRKKLNYILNIFFLNFLMFSLCMEI